MNNQELIERFESDAVPESSFHHADHVRLAFAYLCEYPVLQALDKFAAALKRYATARGKSQLYNETVTHAYFFLIRERMARSGGEDWDEFAARNADLLTWKNGILSRYYHEATLQSDLARSVFLFPDKCA
jgi:CDP-diacylglycerol--glycerol-3-phosphate 3-phosphatidyltransferase